MPVSPEHHFREIPETLFQSRQLTPHEPVAVDLSGPPLYSAEEARTLYNIDAPGVAEITAGGHRFLLADMRESNIATAPFMVVDESFNIADRTGYKGIRKGQTVMFGRHHHTDRFGYESTVSGSHFTVAAGEATVSIMNGNPTNPTTVSGHLHNPSGRRHEVAGEDKITVSVLHKMYRQFNFGNKDEVAPYGYYMNHMIIGRRTNTVKNGVYYTATSEAVVVDDKSETLKDTYNEFDQKMQAKYGQDPATIPLKSLLKDAMHYTKKTMRYSLPATERLCAPHYDKNGLIALSEFVDKGVGVCRQQALLAAFLLERCADDGRIIGTVGVERNFVPEANGSHAWTVFKAPGADAYVVDAAQNFVGTKQEAHKRGQWKYDLSDD